MSPRAPLLLILLFAIVITPEAAADPDHLLCRSVRPRTTAGSAAFTPAKGVRVADRFSIPGWRVRDIRRPVALCLPVGVDGSPRPDPAALAVRYWTAASRTKPAQARVAPRSVRVETPWGEESLRVVGVDDLVLPAADAPAPGDPGPADYRDAFACYDVRTTRAAAKRLVVLTGADVQPLIEIRRPLRLCVPAEVNGANNGAAGHAGARLCYSARLPRRAAHLPPGATRTVRDHFGRVALIPAAIDELCVGVTEVGATPTPIATPTPELTASPTPQPTSGEPTVVAIRVEPARVVRKPGESYAYTAIGTMSDGTERNLTEEVTWSCSSFYVCTAPNVAGDRGRVEAKPFSFEVDFNETVYATDGVTFGWATFTVSTTPIPLVIYPEYTIIRQHTFDYLTALRLDEGGAYRNATQDVIWTSSDPSVAAVPNDTGERSRVDAVGPGLASITATDPLTGNVSAPATFDIFGPLERILVQTARTLDVGQEVTLLPWAYFGRGFPFEGFEPVTIAVSDPTVAEVELRDSWEPIVSPFQRRFRTLRALAVGKTVIAARDELTGVSTSDEGCDLVLTVREPVSAIRLSPPTRSPGLGEIVRLTALGVGSDGATRNYTQRVRYTSSDPSVVIATNTVDDRSKLVTVGPGTATISAVDPVTGLASTTGGSTQLTVRNERVERIMVTPTTTHTVPETFHRFRAVGHYPSGVSASITESVEWTSSDPEVAAFDYFPRQIRARQVGTTVIAANLPGTGISSSDDGGVSATFVVEPVVSIRLTPSAATLAVGEELVFRVIATLASGTEVEVPGNDPKLIGGPMSLRTSNPEIARGVEACTGDDFLNVGEPLAGKTAGVTTITASSSLSFPPLESPPATLTVVAP